MRYLIRFSIIALGLSAIFSPCYGGVVWDESIYGDLSTSFSSPTSVSIQDGSNQIFGSTGRLNSVVDRDYFTITIPVGHSLVSIEVLPETTGDNSGALVSFISVQNGTKATDPATPSAGLAASLLGYNLFGPAEIGQDILDNMGFSNLLIPAAQGFTPPLGAGSYTFWVQETGNPISYGFELTVVPEPESLMLMSIGLASMLFSKHKKALLNKSKIGQSPISCV